MRKSMRIVTYLDDRHRPGPGAIIGDDVVDLHSGNGPASVLDLITMPDWEQRVAKLCIDGPRCPLDSVTLTAPIPHPPTFFAIGLNAKDHRREVNLRWLLREPRLIRLGAGYLLAHPRPKIPYFFTKATSAIVGPVDPIVLPPNATKVDWEGELVAVVGTTLFEASAEEAGAGIAGYTITNDVSIRDMQFDNPTATNLAKSYPSHGPLGPAIVPATELDLESCELRTYLNGELRQRGRIGDLILSPAEIVSKLSTFVRLQPGDHIACGTFAGIGWAAGRMLRAGDRIRVEVDGIGHIDNPVISYPGTRR
ncbi:fumarylacetoacetate hydrolase family protein [Mycolicibacterium fluoranthenivorans]|uniref:fumarylacetoacetate hydrolase family protein n=1 Tax=Mycolicibacterium fluoranthenivorans TaxID=258505 RepID=UPI0021F359A7|nr:fumarylacetoacetate hydrolase family protein [Mycolicibacterium fluoranthenivorans]MCV7354331.1 fumarylacetoacetate hydrolase family protein [Mycolicibacterium fluoranthenivorans]